VNRRGVSAFAKNGDESGSSTLDLAEDFSDLPVASLAFKVNLEDDRGDLQQTDRRIQ
jgi:hypothetical protein